MERESIRNAFRSGPRSNADIIIGANDVFSIDETMMLLGDAKMMGEEIVKSLGH